MFLTDVFYEPNTGDKLDCFLSTYTKYIPSFAFNRIKEVESKRLYIPDRSNYSSRILTYNSISRYLREINFRKVIYKDRKFLTCKGFLAEVINGDLEIIFCSAIPSEYNKDDKGLELQQKVFFLNKYLEKSRRNNNITKNLIPLLQQAKSSELEVIYVDNINSLVLDKYELPKFKSIKQVKEFKDNLSTQLIKIIKGKIE